jgi:hypothetical protein
MEYMSEEGVRHLDAVAQEDRQPFRIQLVCLVGQPHAPLGLEVPS